MNGEETTNTSSINYHTKDVQTVADFKRKESLKFLRGMCFNNAATLLDSHLKDCNLEYVGIDETFKKVSIATFKLAKELFEEAKKQKFDEWE